MAESFQFSYSLSAFRTMQIIRVALDVPIPKLFDYLSEDATAEDVGYRVAVNFGGRTTLGLIVEVSGNSAVPREKLKACQKIIREIPRLTPDWIALGKFCSDYYQAPIGESLMAGIPPRLRRVGTLPDTPTRLELTELGATALQSIPARKKIERRILLALRESTQSPRELRQVARCSGAQILHCIEMQWVASTKPKRQAIGFAAQYELNDEQSAAYDAVRNAMGTYRSFLLFGITGSGKTEVYLNLVWTALQRGDQALILVPEISLTPALEAQFRERFPGANLCVQHSNMSETERAKSWIEASRGEIDIVLGTRLAVFSPLPKLGLIVVDEEQDASFKQQDGLRYSARDMAIFRGRQANVPVMLCSATPSLESLHHAKAGRYGLLRLTKRAHHSARLPQIRIIDMSSVKVHEGVSQPLLEAMRLRLERKEQSLIFLNRRGYAPVLACHYCGWVSGCERCSANLVVHLATKSLRCHYCGSHRPIPRACPGCGSVEVAALGRGTQRVEAELSAKLPEARILRIDSDSTRGNLEPLLELARTGSADILIGTQILAKGHHFERVSLVGVLNADAGLFAADYRAPERLFAQLQQVAGRAGRADFPGEVLIQTRYPGHRLYQALLENDYETYAGELLSERESAGFPPFVHEAVLRASAPRMDAAMDFLASAVQVAPAIDAVTLFDASPAALAKLDGRQRAQLVVQSASRPYLQQFLRQWNVSLAAIRTRVRWHFDVDPADI